MTHARKASRSTESPGLVSRGGSHFDTSKICWRERNGTSTPTPSCVTGARG